MQNRPEARATRSERRAAKLRNQRILFALLILIFLALIAYVAYTAIQRGSGAPAGFEIEGLAFALQAALLGG